MEKTKCLACKRAETELNLPDNKGVATIRTITICENRDCSMFIDYKKMNNWKKGLSM